MFTVYTKKPVGDDRCKYCDWTKELLIEKGIKFHEVECKFTPQVFHDYEHKSYPLVFNEQDGVLEYVGGYEAVLEYLDWNEL